MKIGIVGCGAVSAAHIRALKNIKEVTEIHSFDRDFSRSLNCAEKFGLAFPTGSFVELVSKVDGVIISTPNNTHLDILKNILSIKSIPVLSEKPLTSTLEDAKEFLRLAHPLSAINFNYRFNPVITSILGAKENYALGDFIFIDLSFNKNSALTKKTIGWRDEPGQNNSSGAFGDLGSHLFDLINYFTNSSIDKNSFKISLGTRVSTRTGIKLTVDDHSIAAGKTDNNILFKVRASKASSGTDIGFHIHLHCRNGEMKYSSNAASQINVFHSNKLDHDTVVLNMPKIIDDPQDEIPYWSDSFYFQDKAWINKISGASNNEVATIKDGLNVQELFPI